MYDEFHVLHGADARDEAEAHSDQLNGLEASQLLIRICLRSVLRHWLLFINNHSLVDSFIFQPSLFVKQQ